MRHFAAVVVSLILLGSISAMAAGSSVGHGNGGWFEEFDPILKQYNQSGELFRIEGHCQSACTMFLGIKNVCLDPSATLLFHAGHDRQKNITAAATNRILATYNAALRSYVVSNHYVDTLDFHAISGRDLIKKFGYPECPKN